MDPHHRKIDLQSPSDLAFLHNNIKKAAGEKLDQAIPPSAAPAGEDDAYRRQVEELVHQVHSPIPSISSPYTPIVPNRRNNFNGGLHTDNLRSTVHNPNPNPRPSLPQH